MYLVEAQAQPSKFASDNELVNASVFSYQDIWVTLYSDQYDSAMDLKSSDPNVGIYNVYGPYAGNAEPYSAYCEKDGNFI